MAPLTVAGILQELEDIVGDQLQVVTYKWLGRRYSVPYDTAKRILFDFLTRQQQKIKATFLLSGWTRGDGAAPRHVVRVVEGQQLEREKAKLAVVTGMHVYSVQPGVPKDAGDLYNADYAQTQQLFAKLLASTAAEAEDNPLASNLLNTVQCPGVRFDPALAARRPLPASAAAGKPQAQPAAAAKPAPPQAPSSKASPAKGAAASGGGKKSGASPAGGKKAGGNLANMFKKQDAGAKEVKEAKAAAADKAKAAAAEQAAAAAAAREQAAAEKVAAAAAAAADSSDDSWGSVEEDEPAVAAGKGKNSRQVVDESDSEDEAPPAKAAKTSGKVAAGAKKAAAGGKKGAAAGAGGKRKKPAKGGEGSEGSGGGIQEVEAEAPDGPKFGTVKVRDNEPRAKRVKRVFKTYYNSDGEEVNETVEEEVSDGEGPQPAAQQQQQATQAAAPSAAPAKQAAAPKPPAKSSGVKKGSKVAPPGQKGIMSFFAKK